MNLQLTSQDWLNIVQTLGVLFTMAFTIIQMRKTNQVNKSQIFNSLYQRLDGLNAMDLQNPELLEKLQKTYDPEKDKDSHFNAYVDINKTFFFELYFHYCNGLVTKDEWESWDKTIRGFFTLPYVKEYWNHNKVTYSYGFHTYIDKIIAEDASRL